MASPLTSNDQQGSAQPEVSLVGPQGPEVMVLKDGSTTPLLNFCSNNYLGLASDPRVVSASVASLNADGFGMASVRFISGTHVIHRELEDRIANYVGQPAAALFGSAFDANGGLFEALFDDRDYIVSDDLNHASIIDGVRLCKAKRMRFENGNLNVLEDRLKSARVAGARQILIVTDGVFSMDGIIAPLAALSSLAQRYDAALMVDDCHATGVIGAHGRGSNGIDGAKIDLVTGTFGKALGGAMGGFVASDRRTIDVIRAKSRPYLFSNALPPSICAGALSAIAIAESAEGDKLRTQLERNSANWRASMVERGFDLLGAGHPICPVVMPSEDEAIAFADGLRREGILARAFAFPVVPRGKPRIRIQLSASHQQRHLEEGIRAFERVRDRIHSG